jgi:hypothetical protein
LATIRATREKIYDCVYNRRGQLGDPCTYCGQASSSWDHVPPLHYVERLTVDQLAQARTVKVPACVECNSLIGGAVLLKVQERRALVKRKLRRKYAKHLRAPRWDEEELSEMGPVLRAELERADKFTEHIRERLAWKR